jgi:hypothetical protein
MVTTSGLAVLGIAPPARRGSGAAISNPERRRAESDAPGIHSAQSQFSRVYLRYFVYNFYCSCVFQCKEQ